MTINWLGTTAIAVIIGASAVLAQSQPDSTQKRDESPRAQSPSVPSKDAERPAAEEKRPADRAKDRAGQAEQKRVRRSRSAVRPLPRPSASRLSNRHSSARPRSPPSKVRISQVASARRRAPRSKDWMSRRRATAGNQPIRSSSRVSSNRDATATIVPRSPRQPSPRNKGRVRARPARTGVARMPARHPVNRLGATEHPRSQSMTSNAYRSSSGCGASARCRMRTSMSR
jgi:hypothetical protein